MSILLRREHIVLDPIEFMQHDRILPIGDATDGLVARTKAVLELVGMPCGAPRPPRRPASADDRDTLARMLRDLGVTPPDVEQPVA